MTGPETGFEQLLAALDRLPIPYFVGGSLASSVHGVPRATMGIDMVADIPERQIDSLCAELGSEFYLEPEQAKNALRNGRAFNLIHYSSSYKFDIFPLLPDPYHQAQFERRRITESSVGGRERIQFPVASAEDTILAKLI